MHAEEASGSMGAIGLAATMGGTGNQAASTHVVGNAKLQQQAADAPLCATTLCALAHLITRQWTHTDRHTASMIGREVDSNVNGLQQQNMSEGGARCQSYMRAGCWKQSTVHPRTPDAACKADTRLLLVPSTVHGSTTHNHTASGL